MALQVDAMYDGDDSMGTNDSDLEKVEFGLSVNVGDMGKVALSHTSDKFAFSNNDTADNDSDDTATETTTNSIAGQISVAGLRVYVGTQKMTKEVRPEGTNSAAATESDQKTTYFGFAGGLGDTGLNYLFQWRDIKDSHKPWMLGLYRSLGGGASINFEHANNDDDSEDASYVFLAVGF